MHCWYCVTVLVNNGLYSHGVLVVLITINEAVNEPTDFTLSLVISYTEIQTYMYT